MLESIRNNLKGTLVVVVVMIFIIPMVISGVGTTFSGWGNTGGEAAKVNGEVITNLELERGIRMRKNQLLQQQGVDASSPFLSEENLRGPVLDNLTRSLALATEGKKAGMAISERQFVETLRQQEIFFNDGKFNPQTYRELLRQSGFTPATYKAQVANDLIVNQQVAGLEAGAFATEREFEQLVALTHEKRSFYAVKIPAHAVSSDIALSEEELTAYYEMNSQQYAVPEKVKIEYLDLSVDGLASTISVAEEDIVAEYEAEIANFDAQKKYTVSHILLEAGKETAVEDIQQKLADGASFADLAAEYSDDIATSDEGGLLGVLTPGMFPEAFENAVYTLEEGEVSAPVETDAGIHFIELTEVSSIDLPTLDERRPEIEQAIARARASEDFAVQLETLGELTFSSDSLEEAARALGLQVETSSFFDRNSGSGISGLPAIRNAAFDDEVLINGHNSNTVELGPERAVVLRVAEHREAYVRPFEEVRGLVEARVREQKQREALAALAQEINSAAQDASQAKALAEESDYVFFEYDAVTRNDLSVDPEAANLAFAQALEDEAVQVAEPARDGGYWAITVQDKAPGAPEDLSAEEQQGFLAQIAREQAAYEQALYQQMVVDGASIKLR